VAQVKTGFDNSRTAAAKLPNYDVTREYLQTVKDTKAVLKSAGATPQEVASASTAVANSYEASIVGESVGARYASSGQSLPTNIAQLLRQPISAGSVGASNPAITSTMTFPKVATVVPPTQPPAQASAPSVPAASEPAAIVAKVEIITVSEERLIAAQAAAELAKAETHLNVGVTAVVVGASVGVAAYHASEGKYFRATTDVASVSGVPFNFIPDLINAGLDATSQFFSFLALSQGSGMGVRSIWSSIPSKDASPFRF